MLKFSLPSITIDWNKWIPLLAGIAISAISAIYSVVGLATIFAGSAESVVLMGSALEVGKVVTASYLYRNWKNLHLLVRIYFTVAVIILMLITSMGTFGYLSRAHIEHVGSSAVVEEQITNINQQLAVAQSREARVQTQLNQLDAAVNSMISNDYASRGLDARNRQSAQRTDLEHQIDAYETQITQLNDQKNHLQTRVDTIQRDLGPIRYVAELFYGRSDPALLEKAVRMMIILLVIVFDPLAVILIMMSTNNGPSKKPVRRGPTKRQPRQIRTQATKTDGNKWEDINISITPDPEPTPNIRTEPTPKRHQEFTDPDEDFPGFDPDDPPVNFASSYDDPDAVGSGQSPDNEVDYIDRVR